MVDEGNVVNSGRGIDAEVSSPELLEEDCVSCLLCLSAICQSLTYPVGCSSAPETAPERGSLDTVLVGCLVEAVAACAGGSTDHLFNRPRGPATTGSKIPNRHRVEMATADLMVFGWVWYREGGCVFAVVSACIRSDEESVAGI